MMCLLVPALGLHAVAMGPPPRVGSPSRHGIIMQLGGGKRPKPSDPAGKLMEAFNQFEQAQEKRAQSMRDTSMATSLMASIAASLVVGHWLPSLSSLPLPPTIEVTTAQKPTTAVMPQGQQPGSTEDWAVMMRAPEGPDNDVARKTTISPPAEARRTPDASHNTHAQSGASIANVAAFGTAMAAAVVVQQGGFLDPKVKQLDPSRHNVDETVEAAASLEEIVAKKERQPSEANAKEDLGQNRPEDLEAEVQRIRDELVSKDGLIANLREQLEGTTAEESQQQEIQALSQSLAEATSRTETLQTQLRRASDKLTLAANRQSDLSDEIQQLEARREAEAEKLLAEKDAELWELREEHALNMERLLAGKETDSEHVLAGKDAEIRRCLEEIGELKQRASQTANVGGRLEQEEQELRAVRKTIAELNDKNAELLAQIKHQTLVLDTASRLQKQASQKSVETAAMWQAEVERIRKEKGAEMQSLQNEVHRLRAKEAATKMQGMELRGRLRHRFKNELWRQHQEKQQKEEALQELEVLREELAEQQGRVTDLTAVIQDEDIFQRVLSALDTQAATTPVNSKAPTPTD